MWDHPNPVFIDFETQSACDIKEEGAWAYVNHPSTRILICAAYVDSTYHVWIPDHIRVDSSRWNLANLWPHQLKPKQEVRFYRGKEIPDAILVSCESVPFVAHNAYGFDQYIWERFSTYRPRWLDSLFVARCSGRPGRLDALGKSLFGQGKDRAAKLLPKLTTAHRSADGKAWVYPLIPSGDLEALTRYAIADVEIIRRAWGEWDNVSVEPDVIETNNRINRRGIKVDVDLLEKVEQLSAYSIDQAETDIADMTDGKLHGGNLRSTQQVHGWLDSYGISIVDDNGKPCLRKEIVQRYIDSPYLIDDNLVAVKEIPPVVLEVLKLRMKALRITDAKVRKARNRADIHTHRIYNLIAYYLAHTGRFGSLDLQTHNMPRPHEMLGWSVGGIKGNPKYLEEICNRVSAWKGNDIADLFVSIKAFLPRDPEGKKYVTVDDVCSSLIRLSFIPDEGKAFVINDFSQVEARCVAWMCDEMKLIDAFKNHRDVYKEFATIMYGIPLDQITETQRQVTKQVVLGAGYSMSASKFIIYCANAGVDLTKAGVTAEYCIDTYRDTYTQIAGWKPDRKGYANFRVGGLWKDLDKAIMEAVSNRIETGAGKCGYHMEKKDLICTLPSGRRIHYPEARVEDVIPPYCYTLGLPLNPKPTVVFTSNRGTKSLYGGLATENNSQGICRDIMCEKLVEFDSNKLDTVGHYHDEIVNEVDIGIAEKVLRSTTAIMSTPPEWATGFPLACEGFISPRFTKKPFKGFKELTTKDIEQCRGI